MELLVGAVDDRAARSLRRLLHSFEVVPLAPIVDSERAAALQRQCRRARRPTRSMIDCLVSAPALRLGQPVLHPALDSAALAAHTEEEVDRKSAGSGKSVSVRGGTGDRLLPT